MRIAIMQPYFFPYLGYFQLIKSADIFILLDDVAFIKKGWIHRNRLCFNKGIHWFSVPLEHASQNKSIHETFISQINFIQWRKKFISSLISFYKKQEYFTDGMEIVEEIFSIPTYSIAELSARSLQKCCKALGITTFFNCSSSLHGLNKLKGEKKIIEICQYYQVGRYINAPGGKELYRQSMFSPYGIQLEFIHPSLSIYPVKGRDCVLGLSIIDAIMCCGIEYTRKKLLSGYKIEEAA